MEARYGKLVSTTGLSKVQNALKALLRTLVFFAIWIGVLAVLVLGANRGKTVLANDPSILRLVNEVIPLAAVLAATFVSQLVFCKLGVKMSVSKHGISDVMMGLVIGGIWFGGCLVIPMAFGTVSFGATTVPNNLTVWITACVLNAAFQECLIRGYGFSIMEHGSNTLIATIFTTVIFVVMHPGAFLDGPVAVLDIAVASILLTFLRLLTGGMLAPIAAHAVWNVMGGIGFGIVQLADDYPHIVDTTLSETGLFAGGSMGLEGSVASLAVGLVVVVFLGVLLRRHNCMLDDARLLCHGINEG